MQTTREEVEVVTIMKERKKRRCGKILRMMRMRTRNRSKKWY
jgi:hypothetical protein